MSPTTQRDIQDALDRAMREAWGDLDLAAFKYITHRVSVDRRPATHTCVVVVTIRFDSHARIIHGCRYMLPAKEFAARGPLIHDEQLVDLVEPTMPFIESVKTALKAMPTSLYEYDPRIGVVGGDGELRRCPLLDPPFRFPPEWRRTPAPTFPMIPQGDVRPCPICEEPFDAGHRPMWGGGNLGWVHASCWTEGLPTELPIRAPVGLSYLTVT